MWRASTADRAGKRVTFSMSRASYSRGRFAPDSEAAGPVLGETRYERVSSFLIAVLVAAGVVVAGLAIVWVTNQVWVVPGGALPVELIEVAGGEPEGMPGERMNIEGAAADPTVGVPEPEETEAEPQLEPTLASVLDVMAEVPLNIEDPQLQRDSTTAGPRGRAKGTGRAGRGSGGPGSGIPREQRWLILYDEGQSLGEYARQLDHFGVELATVSGNELIYLSGLSQAKLRQRSGSPQGEKRLYWLLVGGERRSADLELFKRADVPIGNGILMQFYTPEVEKTLQQLEREYAGKDTKQIRRTSFGVRRKGDGYSFYVIDQDYF